MRLAENRRLAIAVLVVVIALSLSLSGGGALMEKRDAIAGQFAASSESITAELREMASNARTMASIGRKYPSANAEYIAAVESSIGSLDETDDPSLLYRAANALTSSVENLYSNLSGLALSETDLQDLRYKYKNYTSATLRASHDPYNDLVAGFNLELAAFPANLVAMLRGVKALVPFA